jgi:hypothetical protein
MELEEKAKVELERVGRIMSSLKVVGDAKGLIEVLKSYHEDCKKFYEKGQFLECVEAAFICWAYVDAGLHLGVFSVPEDMRSIFTA